MSVKNVWNLEEKKVNLYLYPSVPYSRYSQSSSPGRERGHARRHSSADAHQEEGEELTDQTATLTLTSATARQRAQSDSQHDRRRDGKEQHGYTFTVYSHRFVTYG